MKTTSYITQSLKARKSTDKYAIVEVKFTGGQVSRRVWNIENANYFHDALDLMFDGAELSVIGFRETYTDACRLLETKTCAN